MDDLRELYQDMIVVKTPVATIVPDNESEGIFLTSIQVLFKICSTASPTHADNNNT